MSRVSWVVVVLGVIAAVIAVQFDEPWLEISGAALFVALFTWVVVALRQRTGAARSELSGKRASISGEAGGPRK